MDSRVRDFDGVREDGCRESLSVQGRVRVHAHLSTKS